MALAQVLPPHGDSQRQLPRGASHRVCSFWQQGRCSKGPMCRFLHPGEARVLDLAEDKKGIKRGAVEGARRVLKKNTWTKEEIQEEPEADRRVRRNFEVEESSFRSQKVCKYWLDGSACRFGDSCRYLHSHSTVDGLGMMATLKQHEGSITGVALAPDSSLLFTGGADQQIRAWDCNTGRCVDTLATEGCVKAVVGGFGWMFAAVGQQVRAWNVQTSQTLVLPGCGEVISCLTVGKGILVAGTDQGTIYRWMFQNGLQSNSNSGGAWRGHSGAILSITTAGGRVYSGSADASIRVWDAASGQCLHVLSGHSSGVTGLLCWEAFLLSCSLDGHIKVWAATPGGNLENNYTHPAPSFGGALGLFGTVDSKGRPVIGCSYNKDSTVRVYDLPSFEERGTLHSKSEFTAMLSAAASKHIFTGDKDGLVKVWHWE